MCVDSREAMSLAARKVAMRGQYQESEVPGASVLLANSGVAYHRDSTVPEALY
jgi:hypothetical protein